MYNHFEIEIVDLQTMYLVIIYKILWNRSSLSTNCQCWCLKNILIFLETRRQSSWIENKVKYFCWCKVFFEMTFKTQNHSWDNVTRDMYNYIEFLINYRRLNQHILLFLLRVNKFVIELIVLSDMMIIVIVQIMSKWFDNLFSRYFHSTYWKNDYFLYW